MDLYSTIEIGGRVKPELTGEEPAKFADCPVETAQETRTGEPARQPVEEVLQTNGETVENCHAHTTTLQTRAKAGHPIPAKTGRQKSFALSGIQNILNDRGGTGGNNSYNNSRNGNGRHAPVLASTAAWQEQYRPLYEEYWQETPVMFGYFVTFGEQV